MHYLSLIFIFCNFFYSSAFAEKNILQKLTLKELRELNKVDSYYDEKENYSNFTGRVTDRDNTASILKISSESKNIKFFRAGDPLKFRVASKNTRSCHGNIRSVEKNYIVIFVKDFEPCWGKQEYFRRGSLLVFESLKLAVRVKNASSYRLILLKRRRDFLKQLNDINHFVWSFHQQKLKTASGFDKKIIAIKNAKEKAMDQLLIRKQDSIILQKELAFRLDAIDEDLDFYRISKDELLIDRWHLDHDLGKPITNRPGKIKYIH